MTHARRAGLATVLALAAGGLALAALPQAATVRLGGVALLWWYGLLWAPLAAAAAVVPVVTQRPGPAAALWVGPALLLPMAAQGFAGGPTAPLAVLAATLAPLAAALAPVRGTLGLPRAMVAAVLSAGAALVVGAHLRAASQAAAALGGPPWLGLAVGAAAAAAALAAGPAGLWAALPGLGVLALTTVVLGVAVATALTPPGAWRTAASRPAVVFPDRSPWLGEGGQVRGPTALTVTEPQRLTAMSAGTWWVRDGDAPGADFRERRVAEGEAVVLRPGDTVALPAGARLVFEPGRRVPGSPPSGPAWADGPSGATPRVLLAALGQVATLVSGAVVLLARTGGGTPVPAVLAAVAAGPLAALWGVYAVAAAPDLALGGSDAAVFVGMPAAAVRGPAGRLLTGLMVAALVLLLLAALHAAGALGRRAWPSRRPAPGWRAGALVVGGGLVAALAGQAPGRLLGLGFGLAGAVLAPAALVVGRGPRRAAAWTGLVAFLVLAVGGATGAVPGPLADAPALVAGPLAWAAGWVAAGRRR